MKVTKKYLHIDRQKDTALVVVIDRSKPDNLNLKMNTVNTNILDLALIANRVMFDITRLITEKADESKAAST